MSRYTDPPASCQDALRRLQEEAQPYADALRQRGELPGITLDPLTGWRLKTMRIALRQARERQDKP